MRLNADQLAVTVRMMSTLINHLRDWAPSVEHWAPYKRVNGSSTRLASEAKGRGLDPRQPRQLTFSFIHALARRWSRP